LVAIDMKMLPETGTDALAGWWTIVAVEETCIEDAGDSITDVSNGAAEVLPGVSSDDRTDCGAVSLVTLDGSCAMTNQRQAAELQLEEVVRRLNIELTPVVPGAALVVVDWVCGAALVKHVVTGSELVGRTTVVAALASMKP